MTYCIEEIRLFSLHLHRQITLSNWKKKKNFHTGWNRKLRLKKGVNDLIESQWRKKKWTCRLIKMSAAGSEIHRGGGLVYCYLSQCGDAQEKFNFLVEEIKLRKCCYFVHFGFVFPPIGFFCNTKTQGKVLRKVLGKRVLDDWEERRWDTGATHECGPGR